MSLRDHIDPEAVKAIKKELGCFLGLGCIVVPIIILAAITLLHYLPILSAKYQARQLIFANLAEIYPSEWEYRILKSSDFSNYWGVFDGRSFILSEGYDDRWDFCLLVEVRPPSATERVYAFSAGGDRADNKMRFRRVSDYEKCRIDQSG